MPAGIFNLTGSNAVEQGSDLPSFSLIYTDLTTGQPVNLTSATIKADIKKDWNTPVLASFVVTKNSPATDGVIHLALPAASTASIIPGTYRYDVQVTIGGAKTHIIKGFCDILETVTR